ncbi:hypothetical protein LFADAHJC_LOCUS193 [Methylorubrum extorquens]
MSPSTFSTSSKSSFDAPISSFASCKSRSNRLATCGSGLSSSGCVAQRTLFSTHRSSHFVSEAVSAVSSSAMMVSICLVVKGAAIYRCLIPVLIEGLSSVYGCGSSRPRPCKRRSYSSVVDDALQKDQRSSCFRCRSSKPSICWLGNARLTARQSNLSGSLTLPVSRMRRGAGPPVEDFMHPGHPRQPCLRPRPLGVAQCQNRQGDVVRTRPLQPRSGHGSAPPHARR